MSVISSSIKEIGVGRKYSSDENLQRTYTRRFQAFTDSGSDEGVTVTIAVAAAFSLARGVAYPLDSQSFVKHWDAECLTEGVDNEYEWVVNFYYGPDQYSTTQNPINKPLDIKWSGSKYQENIDRDVFDVPILTAADMPYADPIERDASRSLLTITRNEASFNDNIAAYYRDTINADYWYGKAPGTCKVEDIQAETQYDNTYGLYWQCKYIFAINNDGWDRILLNAGYHEKVDGKIKNILIQGVKPELPQLLDATGRALPQGGLPTYKKYYIYNRLPFSTFGFVF